MSTLPRCDLSDLPRVLCACREHGETGFTMTDAERDYLSPVTRWGEAPTMPTPARDQRKGQPIPEYASAPLSQPAPIRAGGGGQGQACQLCSTPAGDAYLCPGCADQAERDLGDVPALIQELEIHATGQSRFSGVGSGGGLPYAERASRLLHDIRNHLGTSIRCLCEERGREMPALGDDTAAMSRWLLAHAAVLPLDPAGPDITNELRRWHKAAVSAIDAPRERVYLGICRAESGEGACATAMHAPRDQAEYECERCGTNYDVAQCLDAIGDRIRDALATVSELVILVRRDGRHKNVTEDAIKSLVRRGRLVRVGKQEPARYRAGDLFAVLDERKAG